MHIHFYAYSFLCNAYSFLCIFITMHIHFYAYSFLCNAYSFLCIFISMHNHHHAYSHRSVSISYSLSHTQTEIHWHGADRHRQIHTHSNTVTSIRLQKILQDRIPIIRDYRLTGWFYNKLYDCRIVCRCYNSYRQAVLYEAILWQVQVVL